MQIHSKNIHSILLPQADTVRFEWAEADFETLISLHLECLLSLPQK